MEALTDDNETPGADDTSATATLADRLVAALAASGIDTCFGVPGGQSIPLYAAARRQGFRHVLMRDERNAAVAADAYARLTGRVGVCDATVGPGATNLVSGLAEAYASGIPVLAIVADIKTTREHLRERGVASQALDQRPLFQGITKSFARVHRPELLDDVLAQALRVATTGRCGPVVIEIPEDVFSAAAAAPTAEFTPASGCWPRFRGAADPAPLAAAVELLAVAERPIVLAGGGAQAAGAGPALERLLARGIPVVTSINGKGLVDERQPLALGAVGVFGHVAASAAVLEADVVVAVGTKFAQFNSFMFRLPAAGQQVVHIDADPAELGRVLDAAVTINGDARLTLDALADRFDDTDRRWSWTPGPAPIGQPGFDERPAGGSGPARSPAAVVAAVDRMLDDADIIVTDASLASGWSTVGITARGGGRHFLAPRGLAGIGWAGGAAIGAASARPAARVVAIAGDGAAAYWLGEIETAVRLRLDVCYVILNNAGYGWIAQGEQDLGISPRSVFGPVDFAAIAGALGARGYRVEPGDDLDGIVQAALTGRGVVLIDAVTSLEASPSVPYGALVPTGAGTLDAYGMG